MPKTSKKKTNFETSFAQELEQLDQFLYDPNDTSSLIEQANPHNRVHAKRSLSKLIAQDAADQVYTAPATAKPAKQLEVSPHVTDLRGTARKQRIVAEGLDHLDRPAKPKFHWPRIAKSTTAAPRISFDTFSKPEAKPLVKSLEVKLPAKPKTRITADVNPWATSLAFAVVALLIILPIKSVWVGSQLLATRNALMAQGQSAIAHLQQGVSSISSADFQKAASSFESANADFQSIRTEIDSYNHTFIKVSEQIPSIGPEFAFSTQLLTVGQNLSQAAAILSAAATKDLSLTESIAETRERFANVRRAMVEASKNIALVPDSSIPTSIRPAISSFKDKAPAIITDLERGDRVMAIAYSLLGGDHLSRQLIVFQNERELRPTGGFMGTYAVADFSSGQLSKFSLPGGGTYDAAGGLKYRLVPPYALQLISPVWNLWDANWWPDFPTSAKKIAWFYQKSGGTTVDGVIAINAGAVKNLLQVVGPIDLPQYSMTLNSENFYSLLQDEIQVNYDKTANKPKQILSDLTPLLLDKIIQYPDKLKIADVLITALANRDIQLYSEHTDIQNEIDALGWSGKQFSTDGDYLQVVSTNVAGGKSDAYIKETIDHRAVIKNDGSIEVTTRITKTNDAPASDSLGYMNNVDYLRAYVPAGSVLLESGGWQQPSPDLFKTVAEGSTADDYLKTISGDITIDDQSGTRINQENGKTVFGNWMQVKPGQTASVYFRYTLPQHITISDATGSLFVNYWSPHYREIDSYSFLAQGQSGNDHTTINHSLLIDPAYKVIWSSALPSTQLSQEANKISFELPLTSVAYHSLLLAGQ